MRPLGALAAVALVATAPAAASESAPGKGKLDLPAFFTGKTHAEGEIKVGFKKPVRHITDTVGRRGSSGELILTDHIREDGKPPKTRRWVMRRSGPDSFTGTMTEAAGPVRIEVDGRQATIRYKMKGGISINQLLTMRDERTLVNHVAAKKLGVRLGRLDGIIRKVD